jgi:hypothetical protein
MKKFLAPLVIIAVLVGAYFLTAGIIEVRMKSARAALRADRDPAQPSDIEPMFATGSTETAEILKQAATYFDRPEVGRLVGFDTLGWQTDRAGLRALLAEKAPAFELLMKAATMEPARFGFDCHAGYAGRLAEILPSFPGFRMLLSLQARLLAAEGRADSALAVLDASFGLSRVLAEPIIIYSIVEVVDMDSAWTLLPRVAPQAGLAAIERSIRGLERLDYSAELVRSIQAEGVLAGDALAQGQLFTTGDRGLSYPEIKVLPLRRYAQLRQIEGQRLQLAVVRLPWCKGRPLLEQQERKFAGTGFLARVGRFATPEIRSFYFRFERHGARRDIAVLGLKALAFRKRTGRLPQALADFAPDAPVDRFSGRPYVYQPAPDGFAVYSVGKDETDNGGVQDDLVFRVRL